VLIVRTSIYFSSSLLFDIGTAKFTNWNWLRCNLDRDKNNNNQKNKKTKKHKNKKTKKQKNIKNKKI
jgi:hypothetical protein